MIKIGFLRQLSASALQLCRCSPRRYVRPPFASNGIEKMSDLGQRRKSRFRAFSLRLAIDLVKQSDGFQNFVIAHEKFYLRVPNHDCLFKASMTLHFPNWRELDVFRRKRAFP